VATADDSARFCVDLVAGLADGGVTTAFVSPGSRNTPLTLAVATDPRIRDINIRDERSAGFMAVGLAKATGVPAIVICTSGSAATHYFPAIIEADQAPTPMIVLTSDRPLRLRGTGAPQTMDQVDLYGRHVTRFVDADVTTSGRDLAVDLLTAALDPPGGPVHANLAFEEPLVPGTMPSTPAAQPWAPRFPWAVEGDVAARLAGRRVLIVASGRQRPGFAVELARVADGLGAAVLADPQAMVTGDGVMAHSDLLAGASADGVAVLDHLRPDVVLRIGPLPTSKPLWTWLESSGVDQILVEDSRLEDPLRSADEIHRIDPTTFLKAQGTDLPPPDTRYREAWRRLNAVAGDALRGSLDRLPFPNEPEIARSTMARAPAGSVVWLASSRPIRDVDAFAAPRVDIDVLSNRGVNGIDGTISSSIGAALGGRPTVLLVGDVAALHDATALSEAARLGVPLRIVVVNNDGGGIFSFLPQARSGLIDHEVYERHWGTPHGLSIATIAASMGLPSTVVADLDTFRAAIAEPVERPEVIEVFTDRSENVAQQASIRAAIDAALGRGDEIEEGT
jgi:2-succinyl-5-enolpyruvyl-6-hydroxy-3-cyclohexene-1-carboxylate synthase